MFNCKTQRSLLTRAWRPALIWALTNTWDHQVTDLPLPVLRQQEGEKSHRKLNIFTGRGAGVHTINQLGLLGAIKNTSCLQTETIMKLVASTDYRTPCGCVTHASSYLPKLPKYLRLRSVRLR